MDFKMLSKFYSNNFFLYGVPYLFNCQSDYKVSTYVEQGNKRKNKKFIHITEMGCIGSLVAKINFIYLFRCVETNVGIVE